MENNLHSVPGTGLEHLDDEALVVTIQATRVRLSAQVLPFAGRREKRIIETATRLLYERHERPLIAYLYGLSRHQALANEVYQESWLRVWKRIDDWQPNAKFSTFLYAVAKNCLSDLYFRKEQKQLFVTSSIDDEETVELPEENISCMADFSLEKHRAEAAYKHCLEQLPLVQREAFLLTREKDMTADDIADLTGAGKEAIKSRIRYAISKLRDCIGERTGA